MAVQHSHSEYHESQRLTAETRASIASLVAEGSVKLDSRRWGMLVLFTIFVFTGQVQYAGFITIVPQTSRLFHVNHAAVDTLTSLFPAIYVFVVIPSCVVLEKYGLKVGVLLGASFNSAAALIRLCAALWFPQYWLLVVAGVLNSLGNAFGNGVPPLLASTWFPEKERTLATALGTLTGFMGFAAAAISSVDVVDGVSTSADDPSRGMAVLFGSHLALALIPTIGFFMMPALPKHPPSKTASGRGDRSLSFLASVAKLLRSFKQCFLDANFAVMIVCFGCVVGTFAAFVTVLAQLLRPLGVDRKQTGWIVFFAVNAGALTSLAIGPIVDRTRQYKRTYQVLLVAELIVVVATSAVLQIVAPTSTPASAGVGLLAGLYAFLVVNESLMLPQYAVVMELAVELVYPQPAQVAGYACMVSMSVWCFAGTQVFSRLLGNSPSIDDVRLVFWLSAELLAGALIIPTIFVRERLNRLEVEKVAATTDA